MAKAPQQPDPAIPLDEPEVVGEPKSYRLHIALALTSLILFQMIVLWFVLPSRAQVMVDFGVNPLDGPHIFDDTPLIPPTVTDPAPMVERQIGNGPLAARVIENDGNMRFSLIMHVRVREGREATRFEREYERRTHQIVEAVEQIMREATPEERQEARLSTIRERAKRAINDILGTPWVQQVVTTSVAYESN